MSEDLILLFTMINGLQFASEGTLQSVRENKGDFYNAVQPELRATYLVYIPNCVSVQMVPRGAVHIGPPKVLVAEKKGGFN